MEAILELERLFTGRLLLQRSGAFPRLWWAHRLRAVRSVTNSFPNRVIGLDHYPEWSPRSPDLNPLDFLLWDTWRLEFTSPLLQASKTWLRSRLWKGSVGTASDGRLEPLVSVKLLSGTSSLYLPLHKSPSQQTMPFLPHSYVSSWPSTCTVVQPRRKVSSSPNCVLKACENNVVTYGNKYNKFNELSSFESGIPKQRSDLQN